MIGKPETVGLNVQDGVIDCTWEGGSTEVGGRLWTWSNNSDPSSFSTTLNTEDISLFTLNGTVPSVALHVNADKGCIPMVIVEEGYEWVPVYSRKLV